MAAPLGDDGEGAIKALAPPLHNEQALENLPAAYGSAIPRKGSCCAASVRLVARGDLKTDVFKLFFLGLPPQALLFSREVGGFAKLPSQSRYRDPAPPKGNVFLRKP